METSTILLSLVFIYLRPTSMEHDPKPKIGPIPWDPPKFWGPALGGPLGFFRVLALGSSIYLYMWIWVQVLRNFPWVGAIGVIGVYWSLGVPNGKWVSYWARNGASTFQNSIEDNASLMHIGLFVYWLIF
jgi:hypothetical protein